MKTKFSVLKAPYQMEIVSEMAEVQQAAIGGYPLFNGYICPNCGERYPLIEPPKKNIDECCHTCCMSYKVLHPLVQCGPKDAIISGLIQDSLRVGSVCVIAQNGAEIIGMATGFVVKEDEEPGFNGFLGGYKTHCLIPGKYFLIKNIVVLPAYQQKGIGRKLLEKLLSAQKCKQALLWNQEGRGLFPLVMNMGGKAEWPTKRTGFFMTIPVKNK